MLASAGSEEGPSGLVEPEAPAGGLAGDLLRTSRPKQWIKNLLVFAAPGAAGVLGHPRALERAGAAFAIFCAVSAGTYFVNDTLDAAADRQHPRKRHRPIAAGRISAPVALGTGAALTAAGIAAAGVLSTQMLAVTAVYAAITVAYSLRLKHEPVLDMGALASGFVLRAVAGGVATGVPLSNWFIIVASFGSLFMVGGKRHAEHLELGEARAGHRPILGDYSLGYLRYVRSVSSAVAIAGYCLWAFEKASAPHAAALWFELSIAPFVLAILRYALVLDAGGGGAPEEVVLGDRVIQGLGLIWLLLFGLGVYGA
jgi:decaprenyl-phosphate phosphoribosyltransferase